MPNVRTKWCRSTDAVPKPHANFVWVPSQPGQEDAIHDILDANRIVAKVFTDGSRISIGEPEADDHILAAAKAIQALQ